MSRLRLPSRSSSRPARTELSRGSRRIPVHAILAGISTSVLLTAAPAIASDPLAAFEAAVVEIGDRLRPSVASIEAWRDKKAASVGSGIVADSAIVITTKSVVCNATRVIVRLPGRGSFPAKVLGVDALTNLAVLKVEANDTALPVARLASTPSALPGSWIMILGNSYGAGPTVAVGTVAGRRPGYGLEERDGLIQVNAPVNPGDSGAAVVNSRGEVIGILFAAMTPEQGPERSDLVGGSQPLVDGGFPPGAGATVGFVMPIGASIAVVNEIREHGEVVRGFLGLRMHPVGADRNTATSERPPGLRIDEVYAGSPAASAGLRAGDLLVAVNGQPVGSPRALQRLVAQSSPADTLHVTVQREQQSHHFSVVLGELPQLLIERGIPQPPEKVAADTTAVRADGIRGRIAALKKELSDLQADLVAVEKRKK